jgi:cell wall-associated NlpC family hydrolase
VRFNDLDANDGWARTAIATVAGSRDWMRDFAPRPDGTYPFRPETLETRKYFARALVKAFAPTATVDPKITFTDLDPSQAFYGWANIAVQRGWMGRTSAGAFLPDKPVTAGTAHRALVFALGLRPTAKRIDGLSTRDGVRFATPPRLGTTLLGMRLGLRYNNPDEAQDVNPSTPLNRKQVAYSLYRARFLESWVVPYLRDQYRGIVLPKMGPSRRAIVNWGLKYVGYPYVWAGEWGFNRDEPSALGGQPVPGFDCSGLSWWALRADDGGVWEISPPRPYHGWSLAQRTSADMARMAPKRLRFDDLLPGDLMFYDGNDDGTVDHVDVYVGNGWSLDSSSSVGGVTLMWVESGWYRDHFTHGRRVLPAR